jgi:hypothetical protein
MIYPAGMVGLLALGLSRQRIVVVLAMTCLAVLAWRMYLAGLPSFQPERTYYSSDGCLLALAAKYAAILGRFVDSYFRPEQWLRTLV